LHLSGLIVCIPSEEKLMSKNFVSLTLAAVLLFSSLVLTAAPPASAQEVAGAAPATADAKTQARGEREARAAAKAKRQVADFGTGPRAKVEVKLQDGAKVRGYISQIDDAHFTVVDRKTGARTVAYTEVKSIKNRYLPKWVQVTGWVALGVMVPFVVVSTVVVAQGGN
jgi:hypothetical protein